MDRSLRSSDERYAPNAGLEPACVAAQCIRQLQQIRDWAHDVAEYGFPHFGEFAQRLENVQKDILRGCQAPECNCWMSSPKAAVGNGCQPYRPVVSPADLNGARAEIVAQLSEMILVLRCEERCYESWQRACREFESICGRIEAADMQARDEAM